MVLTVFPSPIAPRLLTSITRPYELDAKIKSKGINDLILSEIGDKLDFKRKFLIFILMAIYDL